MTPLPRELHAFVEYPVDFGGDRRFVSYSGDLSCVSFHRHDPEMIGLLMSSPTAVEVAPDDLSDEVRSAYDTVRNAQELLSSPKSLDAKSLEGLLEEASVAEKDLNPELRVAAALRIFTETYGDTVRLVFWESEH